MNIYIVFDPLPSKQQMILSPNIYNSIFFQKYFQFSDVTIQLQRVTNLLNCAAKARNFSSILILCDSTVNEIFCYNYNNYTRRSFLIIKHLYMAIKTGQLCFKINEKN